MAPGIEVAGLVRLLPRHGLGRFFVPSAPCIGGTERWSVAAAEFLRAQARGIVACDFLQIDTVLLRRFYVLVFIDLDTRFLHGAGVSASPVATWGHPNRLGTSATSCPSGRCRSSS